MLELLIAAGIAAFPAAECDVAFERRDEVRLVLRMRPACPIGYASTRGAVRAILEQADGAALNPTELSLAFGRIERYPWLSELLMRQGQAPKGKENAHVAAALRRTPEFISLFEGWRVVGVSVEKVLTKPGTNLPYDAILSVALRRSP